MTLPIPGNEPANHTLMRSGTAARLAGITSTTLRIWEHRYSVVEPPKSASGQRKYSIRDVERLRLIKRLTLQGHAIGTLAHLEVGALAVLSLATELAPAGVQRVVVVGQGLAHKLEHKLRPAVVVVFDDLGHAERDAMRAGAIDVLVVHVPSLQVSTTEQLMALKNRLSVPNVIVVYTFGAEPVVEALHAAGVMMCREPVSGRELARMVVSSRPAAAALVRGAHTASRRYSDSELVALTEIPSLVACECPRHLAEIVTLLVNFESYSTECAVRDQNDAQLHRHLQEVTGAARTMLEQALARVVLEEGLVI